MGKIKRILYISNIEVPYRTEFFNELSKYCNLTVLYEKKKSENRDETWAGSGSRKYTAEYLDGFSVGNENSFSIKILKYIFSNCDCIIIGCYNSPVQMMAILLMKMISKPYILSTDGEQFVNISTIKGKIKAFFLRGASKYLAAGEKSADTLREVIGNREIIPYYFSSLTVKEIEEHAVMGKIIERENYVLVIGQYYDYKGLDVAVKVAAMDSSIRYKFVGMGKRTDLFIKETGADKLPNVEIVPFLQKRDLEQEYLKCAVMVLPSRQECWGLVINEAASFGTPIVSTWGSGAAVEFFSDDYPQFLAKPGNIKELYDKIRNCMEEDNKPYSDFLIKKSKEYTIDKQVRAHLKL